VSRTVSTIFSVKEWRDLETEVAVVQGHEKWRHSIDHNTTSYWSASIAHVVPFSRYLRLNNRDLEI